MEIPRGKGRMGGYTPPLPAVWTCSYHLMNSNSHNNFLYKAALYHPSLSFSHKPLPLLFWCITSFKTSVKRLVPLPSQLSKPYTTCSTPKVLGASKPNNDGHEWAISAKSLFPCMVWESWTTH